MSETPFRYSVQYAGSEEGYEGFAQFKSWNDTKEFVRRVTGPGFEVVDLLTGKVVEL